MAVDVTQIIEPVRDAVAPVGTSLSDAWSAVIGDRIAAWRLKNAAALQTAVNIEVSKLGLKLDRSKIPERYAFAWFTEATKQDEPEIQELFARLLARAAAGDEDAADRRHLEILTRFTPMDANVMARMFPQGREVRTEVLRWNEYDVWRELRGLWGAPSSLALEHLITLGVLERSFGLKNDGFLYGSRPGDSVTHLELLETVERRLTIDVELHTTATGMSLHRAISPIESKESDQHPS